MSSPKRVKLLAQQCLMIAQYTPHGDDKFSLISTYSRNVACFRYFEKFFIPLTLMML